MSLPNSNPFCIQDIPNAGRGVISSCQIPKDIVLLSTGPPATHVIFRQYRKEVCAQCFHYDRGRSLPVRDQLTGKVYCSDVCQKTWTKWHGDAGVEAWRGLNAFLQANGKMLSSTYNIVPTGPSPEIVEIDAAWTAAEATVRQQQQQASQTQTRKRHKQPAGLASVDPDLLAYLLSGILNHTLHPQTWDDSISALAKDTTPYKSHPDLAAHTQSFQHLSTLLPPSLLPHCTTSLCRALIDAGSHNAFGIRAGGEDGEEYLGYGLYPEASYFNHACEPNVLKRRVGACWEFRAAREVSVGEECCITYLGGDERELTVGERRERLSGTWGFECGCERCKREAG